VLLVERGLFESRARARAAIEAGRRDRDGKQVAKASEVIAADATLSAQPAASLCLARRRQADGRAGTIIPIEIEDHVCLGHSAHRTGGFTEVLLSNGASLVFAIDVGHGQLHPSLHGHPKIVSMEETDIESSRASACRRGPTSS